VTRWRGEPIDHGLAIELLVARAQKEGTTSNAAAFHVSAETRTAE